MLVKNQEARGKNQEARGKNQEVRARNQDGRKLSKHELHELISNSRIEYQPSIKSLKAN